MKRREVTDAMVERAWKAMPDLEDGFGKDHLRHALEAALNEPPKPEIVVTEEMLAAGNRAWKELAYSPGDRFDKRDKRCLLAIYRAMRALELKPVPPLLVCAKCGSSHIEPFGFEARDPVQPDRRVHIRAGDMQKHGSTNGHYHRRSTD